MPAPPPVTEPARRSARAGLPALLGALALVVFGAVLRVQLAFEDPGFDAADPRGMLRSDPAELAYLARRVQEGGAPALGADPRIAWPEATDVWREFSVGQEFLIAAAARLAPETPLHVVATVVAALTAALVALALYLATVELLGSRRAALGAALLYTVLPAAYRTVGLAFMREDLSLPLLAAAAWASARAARTERTRYAALAGILAAAAAATWHGAGVGLNALALALAAAGLSLTRDQRSSAAPRLFAFGSAAFAVAALLVPAARAKGVAFSFPATVTCATALFLSARQSASRIRGVAGLGVLATGALVRRAIVGADLDHVGALLLAKLEHGGVLPADPTRLAPDVRLMWQGPFEGLGLAALVAQLGAPLVVASLWASGVLVAVLTRRAVQARSLAVVVALLATVGLAVLAERAAAFAALAVPIAFVFTARAMARAGQASFGRSAAVALVALQALLWAGFVTRHSVPWYRPLAALEERRDLVALVERTVPAGQPVLTDFLLGPALLADHDRPIVLQPKWETAAARARVHRFFDRLYRADAAALAAYMRTEVRCEWLLLDARTLVDLRATRFAAGLPADTDPRRAGSALAALLGPPDAMPAEFELVAERGASRLLRRTD